jgi:iron complex transport system substrate-binding protein
MRLRLPLALAATAALLLAGCAGSDDDEPGPTPEAQSGFPVTVGDLTLEAQPTQIVSLCPTATEMLFAIDAGPQVVAVDEYSSYPPEAPTTELSGFTPEAEAIAGYEPDLVVICSGYDAIAPQLETLDIPLHLTPDNPTSVDDVYTQITDLGALTGHTGEADAVVTGMSDEIARLVDEAPERAEPLTYYIEIDETLWTYTSQSYLSGLFAMVGLENIAVSEDPAEVTIQLSAEVLVDADPDLIFLTNAAYGQSAETVSARDGWSEIEAVSTGQIVELDTDIASRWGPRTVDLLAAVVDAVSQVP